MPRVLSSTAITEKNKLGTTSVFLVLLKVDIPGVADPVRIAANNEDVSWAGQTWSKFPFGHDPLTEESKGTVPQVVLKVMNASRAIERKLQDYDEWMKANGVVPCTMTLYVVNTLNLASATPETEHTFDLLRMGSDAQWAYFTVGAPNPWNYTVPRGRVLRNHCRVKVFKDADCGYGGASSVCGDGSTTGVKTLAACRYLLNSARFGGFAGVGNRGVRVYGA